jgi:hypothetical protein
MGYPSMRLTRTATGIEPPEPPALKLGDRDEDEMADVHETTFGPDVLVKGVRRDAEGVGGFPSGRGTRDGAVSEPCSHDRSRLVASSALAASSRPSAFGLSIDAPRNAR